MKNGKRLLSLTLAASMITSMFLTGAPVSASEDVDSGMWVGTAVESIDFIPQDSGIVDQRVETIKEPVDPENGIVYLAPSYDWEVYDEDRITFEDHIGGTEITPESEERTLEGETVTVYEIPANELTPDDYIGAALIDVTIPKITSEGNDDLTWSINVPLDVPISAMLENKTLDSQSVSYISERLENADTVKVTVEADPKETVTVPADAFKNLTTGKTLEITVTSSGESVTWSFEGAKNSQYGNNPINLSVSSNQETIEGVDGGSYSAQSITLKHDGEFPTQTVKLTIPNTANFSSSNNNLVLRLKNEKGELEEVKGTEVDVSNDGENLILTLPHASKWVVASSAAFTGIPSKVEDATLTFNVSLPDDKDFVSLDKKDLESGTDARSDYFEMRLFENYLADVNMWVGKYSNIKIEPTDPKFKDLQISLLTPNENEIQGSVIDIKGRFTLSKDSDLNGFYQVPVKVSFTFESVHGDTTDPPVNYVKTLNSDNTPLTIPLYISEGDPIFIDGAARFEIDSENVQDSYESSEVSIYAPGQKISKIEYASNGAGNWEIKPSDDNNSFTLINKKTANNEFYFDSDVQVNITLEGSNIPLRFDVRTDVNVTGKNTGVEVTYDELTSDTPYTDVEVSKWGDESDVRPSRYDVQIINFVSSDPDALKVSSDNRIRQSRDGAYSADFDVVISGSELSTNIGNTDFIIEDAVITLEGYHIDTNIDLKPSTDVTYSDYFDLYDVSEKELVINDLSTYTRTILLESDNDDIVSVSLAQDPDSEYGNSYFTIHDDLKLVYSEREEDYYEWEFTISLKNEDKFLPDGFYFDLLFDITYRDDSSQLQTTDGYCDIDYEWGEDYPVDVKFTYLDSISDDFTNGESIKLLMTSSIIEDGYTFPENFQLNLEPNGPNMEVVRGSVFYRDLQQLEVITIRPIGDYKVSNDYEFNVSYSFIPTEANPDVKLKLPEDTMTFFFATYDVKELLGISEEPEEPTPDPGEDNDNRPSGGGSSSSGSSSSGGGGGSSHPEGWVPGGIIILDGTQQIPGEPVPWDGVTVGETGGALVLDTKTYTMAPGGIYDILMTLVGADVSEMQIYSSRPDVAEVTSIGDGKYRVTALGEGETYIMFEVWRNGVMLNHASVKVTIADGAAASGEVNRVASLF